MEYEKAAEGTGDLIGNNDEIFKTFITKYLRNSYKWKW